MNKNVMITGANGDIGRASARRFAREGWNVCLCGHRESSLYSLKEFAEELSESYGIRALAICGDVSVKRDCEAMVAAALEHAGTLDALVNNAGTIAYSLMIRTRQEDYKRVQSCNQEGVFYMMQAAGQIMKKQMGGSIVNVSSIAGIKGCAGATAYAASKGAVNAMTKSAAVELAPYHVRVNAVAPGMIEGGLSDIMGSEQKQRASQSIALKRFGLPQEVAEGIYFLASEAASYITGSILRIDGGLRE